MTDHRLPPKLLANGPYARADAPFSLLEVRGPDARAFLQRLCTQDVASLQAEQLAPVAFLDAKGKLLWTALAWCEGDAVRLETPSEQVDGLLALLERYHFTEKLELARLDRGMCHELVAASDAAIAEVVDDDGGLQLRYARRGVLFERRYGGAAPSECAALPSDLAEAARMVAGVVRVGVDTEASTLALEAGLDDHCSTRKGCYTGQEIVARIHTYGHVNRKLCLLELDAGADVDEPQTLVELEDELPVGRVMSAVAVEGLGLRVGLGYLPEDFQAAGTRLQLEDGAGVAVVAWG